MTTRMPPICLYCARYRPEQGVPGLRVCTAFPTGIPTAILHYEANHRQPYPGDHGQQFVGKTPADAEQAAWWLHIANVPPSAPMPPVPATEQ